MVRKRRSILKSTRNIKSIPKKSFSVIYQIRIESRDDLGENQHLGCVPMTLKACALKISIRTNHMHRLANHSDPVTRRQTPGCCLLLLAQRKMKTALEFFCLVRERTVIGPRLVLPTAFACHDRFSMTHPQSRPLVHFIHKEARLSLLGRTYTLYQFLQNQHPCPFQCGGILTVRNAVAFSNLPRNTKNSG